MFKSKNIKALCYIVMCSICVLSVVFIILGIKEALDKNWISIIWIIAGEILPLTTAISLYPIFALANIDDNLSLLNEKMDTITAIIGTKSVINKTPSQLKNKVLNQEIIDFMNQKYKLDLSVDDNLETIKCKVISISDTSSAAHILIQKISSATDMETVVSALSMHKVTHYN